MASFTTATPTDEKRVNLLISLTIIYQRSEINCKLVIIGNEKLISVLMGLCYAAPQIHQNELGNVNDDYPFAG